MSRKYRIAFGAISLICLATFGIIASAYAEEFSRRDNFIYNDNQVVWVLGQTESSSNQDTGIVELRFEYDSATSKPVRRYVNGKLEATYEYGSLGQLSKVIDGKGNYVSFSNWKQGVPQTVAWKDGSGVDALVNSDGVVTNYTNERRFSTCYEYDPLLRVRKVSYPSEAGSELCDLNGDVWAPTHSQFEFIQASEYGVGAGHWRQTVSTGFARKVIVYNALLSPMVVQELDVRKPQETQRFSRFAYDARGRSIFNSYPSVSASALTGTWTDYDALNRAISIAKDADSGLQSTIIEYKDGGKRYVKDPLQHLTVTEFQAYDTPDSAYPVTITEPDGVYTKISRDQVGRIKAISRNNAAGVLLSRRFVYDSAQRLCKIVEPETGVSIFGYDAANNVESVTLGLSIASQAYLSLSDCQLDAALASGRTSYRAYNERDRLISVSFPKFDTAFDARGEGDQLWVYTADGMPQTVTTYNGHGDNPVINQYDFNNRGLLISEDQHQAAGGGSSSFDYGYDENGYVALTTYPSGLSVDYAPNALGQPSKVGTFAQGIVYFPNGSIKGFTYGNGLVRTVAQNTQQLVKSIDDGALSKLEYSYDEDGNVRTISDLLDSRRSLTNVYDSRHRLRSSVAQMFGQGGQAAFEYDDLDNLTSMKVADRYDYGYVYDGYNRLLLADNRQGQDIGFAFDYQGNLSQRNGVAYRFDYGNRLRETSGSSWYRYDANGLRVAKGNNQGIVYWMYDRSGLLRSQRDLGLGKKTEFLYIGDTLVAQVTNTQVLPVPVTSVPASSSTGFYSVTWSALPDATRYEVQEKIGSSGSWATAYTGTALTVSLSGKGNNAYSYRSKMCLYENCGPWGNEATIAVQLVPSSSPTISAPDTSADGNFTVLWSTVAGAPSYKLEKMVNGAAWTESYSGSGTNFVVSSAVAGTWSFKVRACDAGGCGGYSNVAQTVVTYPPAAPTSLVSPSSSANGSYQVSWAAVSGATEYRLEESFNSSNWVVVSASSAAVFNATGRISGAYSYRLRACNSAGCSNYSGASTTNVLLPPGQITSISSPATSASGTFTVSWGGVTSASAYDLRENSTAVYTGAATSYGYTNKGNGSYSFSARACNSSGCGAWSSAVTTVVSHPATSGTTTVTGPTSSTTGNYNISWVAIADADSYELQENPLGAGWAVVISGNTLSFPIANRASGTYQYRARGCNMYGCGPWSAVITTQVNIPPPVPAVPTGLRFTYQALSGPMTHYKATWNAVSNVTRYELTGFWGWQGVATSYENRYSGNPNKSASLQVRACNNNGCSAWSSSSTVIPY